MSSKLDLSKRNHDVLSALNLQLERARASEDEESIRRVQRKLENYARSIENPTSDEYQAGDFNDSGLVDPEYWGEVMTASADELVMNALKHFIAESDIDGRIDIVSGKIRCELTYVISDKKAAGISVDLGQMLLRSASESEEFERYAKELEGIAAALRCAAPKEGERALHHPHTDQVHGIYDGNFDGAP